MRIYLVGFMASGKSTLGSRVAGRMGVPFLDTDQVVESQAGMSVEEIFAAYGENYFRLLEKDVLHQTAFYPKSLNATGGGLPVFSDNMAWMLTHGITVYLQWPDDRLVEHVMTQHEGRPLLSRWRSRVEIQALLDSRKPVYEKAAITLELEGQLEEDLMRLEDACKYIW